MLVKKHNFYTSVIVRSLSEQAWVGDQIWLNPEFRKKLETSDVEKIRDGSIAHELEMVNHNLRTQLDNVKRKEMDR